MEENARLLDEIAEIAHARLMAGDTSELDAGASLIEAFRARDETRRLLDEVEASRYRFLLLLGLEQDMAGAEDLRPQVRSREFGELPDLVAKALAARPDLRAAETRIEAEGERVGWERSRVFRLIGLLDANEAEHGGGYDPGPGVQWELPIFNPNRDGIERATAQMEQAAWEYVAARRTIVMQVQEAYTRYRSADASRREWSDRIVPSLEATARGTEQAYQAGEVSRLAVLEMARRLVEARIRQTDVLVGLRREEANLIYSIGMDPFQGGGT
jgi:cobalt-zinc-cadmium efflux system outer membrane protein